MHCRWRTRLLLVVSDRLRIEIHTHFTGTPSEKHVFVLDEMERPRCSSACARCGPIEAFRPGAANCDITEEARAHLRRHRRAAARGRRAGRRSEPLPDAVPVLLLRRRRGPAAPRAVRAPGWRERERRQQMRAARLSCSRRCATVACSAWMQCPGSAAACSSRSPCPNSRHRDVAALKTPALNWSAIDPSIFGTLFERGLDPAKRSQLGAHYTDPATILRLVEPVVRRPPAGRVGDATRRRWRRRSPGAGSTATRSAMQGGLHRLSRRLKAYRVLDPAAAAATLLPALAPGRTSGAPV